MNHQANLIAAIFLGFVLIACKPSSSEKTMQRVEKENDTLITQVAKNTAEQILAKPQVPILCYHRISEDNKSDYTVTRATFDAHMKILSDSGYRSISPDQLYEYLVYNHELPEKPFLVSFDDSRIEHSTIAAPVLEKYGFRGAFFIMTITYNKKKYMTTDQIAALAKAGHTVGLHSWDHTMATKYLTSEDWEKQIKAPKEKLEKIIGTSVDYFAYPYGITNSTAAAEMSTFMKLSFILSTKRDTIHPLQTVRRMIVPEWTPQGLLKSMRRTF